jgi:predicted PurR-regulated permease PerM
VTRLQPRRLRQPVDGGTIGPAVFPRGLVVLLGIAGAVIAIAGMQAIAGLLAPIFLALMLTVTVSPITGWLRRRGFPTWLAMLGTLVTVNLILFGLAASVAFSVARLVDLLPTYQKQFTDLRSDILAQLQSLGVDQQQIQSALTKVTDPGSVTKVVEAVFGGLTSALTNTVFLLAVVLFMCVDSVNFGVRIKAAETQRPAVVGALESFAQGTRSYLWVSTVFGLIVAVIDTLMLWGLGVPLPALWGLLAFITNYIPNVGFVIGLIPPALLALLQGGPSLMIWVIVLYCAVNFIIQSVIQPKVVGDAVGLSATVSFVSLIFWAWVLGPLGALLAIPMSLLAKGLLIDVDPATRWINLLLGGGPLPAEPAAAPGALNGHQPATDPPKHRRKSSPQVTEPVLPT